MKLIALLAFLLPSIAAISQTSLVGTVTDADTGEPVVFTSVALYQNGILKTRTDADLDGNYQFTEIEPGIYDVEFSFTGYSVSKVMGLLILQDKRTRLDIKLEAGKSLTHCLMTICRPVVDQSDMTQGMRFSSYDIKQTPFRW